MASSTPKLKIPSTMFDVYQQYKISTAILLKWLSDNHIITSQSSVNIDLLQRSVENASANNIQIPDPIYHAFRESVAKRRQVTRWFMSAELSAGGEISQTTSNHVHFTERLEKAFITLCRDRKEASTRKQAAENEYDTALIESHNPFEGLRDLMPDLTQALSIEEVKEDQLSPSQTISGMEALEASKTSTLEDDPFIPLLRIHLLMREFDSICENVITYWKQVSNGSLPLPFAAWLTNAAYEAAKRLSSELIDIDKDAQEHQDVYIGVVNHFNIVFSSCPVESKYDDFTQGRGMTFPWIAISCFKVEWKREQISSSKIGWEDPVKCIPSKYDNGDSDSLGKDLEAYKSILRSIGKLLRKEKTESQKPSFTASDMNPLLSDVSDFLENQSEHPDLGLVFGVHMLLEAYRGFVWAANITTRSNCRITALRFARDMKDMVQSALSSNSDPMVQLILEVDALHLDEYLAENCFDLYYQSPWTAGFHICEILHYSIDTGLRLINSKGRVGAVLHIYNALRQLKMIVGVAFLDDLCETFRREIFLGSLPTENFSSHFRRFLGGTVQTETGQASTNPRQSKRAIGLPSRLPSAQDYTKRLMPSEMSLFYKLYNDRFATTADFWSRLYTGKNDIALPKSQLEGIMEQVNRPPFAVPLTKLREVVVEEFTGRLPMASIKYHSIYAICLRALRDMAALKFREDGVETTPSDAHGFTFVETLLVAIVEHQRDVQMSKLLPYLSSLRLARQALVSVFTDKNFADFVWQF